MTFFTADDFKEIYKKIFKDGYVSHNAGDMWEPASRVDDLANIANAKLQREGKVVYGWPIDIEKSSHKMWSSELDVYTDEATHRALLINIEELPKKNCEHVGYIAGDEYEGHFFECEKCGKTLKPTAWSVCDE